MKIIKIAAAVLILLANAAYLRWLRRGSDWDCDGDEPLSEELARKIIRWRYALFALDAAYAVFSIMCIVLNV